MEIDLGFFINPGFAMATLMACWAASEAGSYHPKTGEPKLPVSNIAPWVIAGLVLLAVIAYAIRIEIAVLAVFPIGTALFSLAYANNPRVIAQRRFDIQQKQLDDAAEAKAKEKQAEAEALQRQQAALKATLDATPPVPKAPSSHSPLSPAAQKIAAEIARRRGQ